MADIQIGDKVRVKERKDWASPAGYVMANSEGTVIKWVEYDEVMEEFNNYYVSVKIDKCEDKEYIGHTIFFRKENLEKI